ncbi:LppP/LprE family lipoprotein [Dietzia sp.]|uniref:LppP/LprE family lipoprotein n=1 Tax=Dietzia sp. TaxID=1871616 RepID=UPI002FD8B75C
MTRHTRRMLVFAGTLAVAAPLAACNAGAPSTDSPSTVIVTASPSSARGGDQTGGDAGNGDAQSAEDSAAKETVTETAEPQDCRVDPDSPEIGANIANVPAPNVPGLTWIYEGDSNYNACADLSYASLIQSEQGNAQFQTQLMLFHQGEFLGVGANTPEQHVILSTTPDSVTVRYKDWEALDAAGAGNAMASAYTTDVIYRWNGSKVVPEGRIPNQGLAEG